MSPAETPQSPPQQTEARPRSRVRGCAARVLVPLCLVLFAVYYLSEATTVPIVNPDSAIYMGLGRSLARGEGYRFNRAPYSKYPPVVPAMMAGVYLTAGEHFGAMQAVIALTGVGALVAAYALVRGREGPLVALGVAILTGLCTWFVGHAAIIVRADVPYAFFSLLALWAAERRLRASRFSALGWAGVGFLVLLAIGTHLQGVALVPGILGGVLLARGQRAAFRKRLAAVAAVAVLCGALAAGWVVRGWDRFHMAGYESLLTVALRETPAEQLERAGMRLREWTGTPLNVPHEQVPLGVAVAAVGLLLVPGLAACLRRVRSCSEFTLLSFFLLSTLVGGKGGHERYVIPVVPLLLYYGAVSLRLYGRGLAWVVTGGRPGAPGWRGRLAAKAPRWAVAVPFLALLAHGVYCHADARHGVYKLGSEAKGYAEERTEAWLDMGRWVSEHVPQDAVLFPSSGRCWAVAHFFLDRRMAPVWGRDKGRRLLRSILATGADHFVLEPRIDPSPKRFASIHEPHPEVLTLLRDVSIYVAIYRIDRAAVRRIVGPRPPGS